ncbi:MAG: MarR family EPS-associated transcriptional regulator [Candidatus Omnitrophota bacterium]
MNEQYQAKEEVLYLIREIDDTPGVTQRDLSAKLGISLGKTNYLLKELVKKGIVKIQSFTTHDQKLKKISYILTPEGISEQLRLTYYYLKLKEKEYLKLKQEAEMIAERTQAKETIGS